MGPLKEGTRIFDLGTGGGFPGIPLAVFYPHCQFHLIDRIGKKIRVANEIADSIGLANVSFQHGDSGECHERFDYVVSRAVMALGALASIAMRNVASCKGKGYANRYSPGIVCLKGGDLNLCEFQIVFGYVAVEFLLLGAVEHSRVYGYGSLAFTNIKVGAHTLKVLHVPGHSPGSIALYSAEGGFVIGGDVLFKGSIGRTDLL